MPVGVPLVASRKGIFTAKSSPRIFSIDGWRGVGVLVMIFWHFLKWLADELPKGIYFLGKLSFGSLAPSIFLLVTGMCLYLSVARRKNRGETDLQIKRHILKRCSALILIGFALNVILWGVGKIWIWDILETIAVSNLITYFLICYLSSNFVFIGLASLVLLLQPFTSTFDLPSFVPLVVRNALFKGVFPIIPWLSFVIVGALLGKLLLEALKDRRKKKFQFLLLYMAFLLLGFATLLHFYVLPIDQGTGWLTYFMFSVGVSLLIFSVLFCFEGERVFLLTIKPLIDYGVTALAIYIGHYLFIFNLLRYFDLTEKVPFAQAIAISFALLIIVWLAALVWLKLKHFANLANLKGVYNTISYLSKNILISAGYSKYKRQF